MARVPRNAPRVFLQSVRPHSVVHGLNGYSVARRVSLVMEYLSPFRRYLKVFGEVSKFPSPVLGQWTKRVGLQVMNKLRGPIALVKMGKGILTLGCRTNRGHSISSMLSTSRSLV